MGTAQKSASRSNTICKRRDNMCIMGGNLICGMTFVVLWNRRVYEMKFLSYYEKAEILRGRRCGRSEGRTQ